MTDPKTPIHKSHLLVVDDEREHAQVMCEALTRLGHKCDLAYSLPEAAGRLRGKTYDVIVTDLVMDGKQDGLEILRLTKDLIPPPPVVLVTAHGDVPTCKLALNEGAYDYIEKPLDLENFRAQVNRAAERAALLRQNMELQDQIFEGGGFEGIIGKSAGMQRVLQVARQVAGSDIPVLIMGESGTGKELIARAIHNQSDRNNKPFVAINCGALPENLMESELFGHTKGAFTDAKTDKKGLFRSVDGGTLFLDEISEMPLPLQVKLLRALQEREVTPIGSSVPAKFDARIIAATNRNLEDEVGKGNFREDLFYRLNVIEIHLPALRERREDIPLLVKHFISRTAQEQKSAPKGVSREAMSVLINHNWQGNVRELQNAIERSFILSGDEIDVESLPPKLKSISAPGFETRDPEGLKPTLEEIERRYVFEVLKSVDHDKLKAANILGMDLSTLYRKLKRYDEI